MYETLSRFRLNHEQEIAENLKKLDSIVKSTYKV